MTTDEQRQVDEIQRLAHLIEDRLRHVVDHRADAIVAAYLEGYRAAELAGRKDGAKA